MNQLRDFRSKKMHKTVDELSELENNLMDLIGDRNKRVNKSRVMMRLLLSRELVKFTVNAQDTRDSGNFAGHKQLVVSVLGDV